MDNLPPSARTSLRTLGATGASASASACDSFILVFSTTPIDKTLPSGRESLITLGTTGANVSAAASASFVASYIGAFGVAAFFGTFDIDYDSAFFVASATGA